MHPQLTDIVSGNRKALARAISIVENEAPGFEELLRSLPQSNTPVIGITGSPGAGKSTLTDALIGNLVENGKNVAVICVDPSSPFNLGALLGDRIRMGGRHADPRVYIRSLASRGALGGLSRKIIEITDVVRAGGFDYILIETVGVGQSEIEIAGLADATVVTMVPEGGDEIQTMKAGIMEIADVFVVNKADRPGADSFVKNLRSMLAGAFSNHAEEVAIIKTVASEQKGIGELRAALETVLARNIKGTHRLELLTDKLYSLIQKKRMKDVDRTALKKYITDAGSTFNLYDFAAGYPD